jgi:hypothetical protein
VAVEVRVKGAEELVRLSRQLRAAGDQELRRDFYRGLNRASKPLKEAAKQNAGRVLPRRGGLAALVAKSRLSTSVRGGGANPGVRITGKGRMDLDRMDRGQVRHPVFGNRRVWVVQSVTPRWFTEPMEAGAEDVRTELLSVFDDVARRLGR